jgi:hypothetical protein
MDVNATSRIWGTAILDFDLSLCLRVLHSADGPILVSTPAADRVHRNRAPTTHQETE